ncbi:MAG TPA: polysaccharide deacetylase family protein, partial [Actinomycetota bacterium]|nr:polysaccharide deacetylase family protein [Actinomycetota bacterium]
MTNGVVLAYHAVGSCAPEDDPHHLFVTPTTFERHMAFLAKRKRVVTLEDALGGGPPGRVAITFDDAYRNVAEVASPILERYGFPATVFAPTGFLDGTNTWDDPSPCDLSIASADELAALARRNVTIESHGHGHIDMASSPTADVVADLATSRGLIQDITGRAPRYLAYPFGRSSG